MPDLRYSDAEEQLRAVVRDLLADRSPLTAVLARVDAGEADDVPLWRALAADLGCAGLLIDESHGGAGASYREAAVVAEETGKAAACVPYLTSAVMATTALLGTGDADLLGGLASGRLTAALAVGFAAMPPAPGADLAVMAGADRARRRTATRPAWPGSAERSPGWPGRWPPTCSWYRATVSRSRLYAVDATAAGVTRTPLVSLDATRPLADVTLDRVPGRPVATGEDAARAVAAALTAGAGVLASELFGVAEQCLGMTVSLRQGTAPVRPPGRLVPGAQAPARRRVGGGDPGPGRRQVRRRLPVHRRPRHAGRGGPGQGGRGDAAVLAAQECVQLHGGIGFTWEHPAHLLLKRAKSASMALGTPDRHRAALAALVDLPPPPGG